MGRLLPFKSESSQQPGDPRVLDLDDDATEETLSALSSETARKILATLYEEPKTPPEIRDEVGTSLQNVHYHVENLQEADLIQPAGSGYSEKGTEMTIYAPASEALVLFAGQDHDRSRLKSALARLLGAVGVLALASVALRRVVESLDGASVGFGSGGDAGGTDGASGGADGGDVGAADAESAGATGGDGGDSGAEATTEADTIAEESAVDTVAETATPTDGGGGIGIQKVTPTDTPTPEATSAPTDAATDTPVEVTLDTATEAPEVGGNLTAETATPTGTALPDGGAVTTTRQAAETGADGLLSDPAVAFFLGGLFMIAVFGVWWYWQS